MTYRDTVLACPYNGLFVLAIDRNHIVIQRSI